MNKKEFSDNFVLHFPKDDPSKVRDFLDFLMNSKNHFSTSQAAEFIGSYYLENEEGLPSKMIYTINI